MHLSSPRAPVGIVSNRPSLLPFLLLEKGFSLFGDSPAYCLSRCAYLRRKDWTIYSISDRLAGMFGGLPVSVEERARARVCGTEEREVGIRGRGERDVRRRERVSYQVSTDQRTFFLLHTHYCSCLRYLSSRLHQPCQFQSKCKS